MNEQSYELMVNCAKGAVMGKNALNSMANYVSGEEAKQFLLKAAAEHEAIGKKINEALEAENRERLRRSHERRQQAISAEFAEDERLRTLAATARLEARFLAAQQSERRSRLKQRLFGLTKAALVLAVGVLVFVVSADRHVVQMIGRWGSTLFEPVPEAFDADDFKKDDRS